ncbi:MAG: 50S ribosomal protein L6 [Limibacillus sp.]
MSRVGINPVTVPSGVELKIDGAVVTAKGKLGQLSFEFSDQVFVAFDDGKVTVKPANDTKKARALWGTTRARIANLVEGVSEGFKKELEIVGVGYRASVQGKSLNLQLGFSHDVNYPIPEGISIKCEKPTSVEITGADKQQVGQVAAEIRAYRPPEPYKGKGVRYADEYILRKEGKKK